MQFIKIPNLARHVSGNRSIRL